MTSAVSLVSSDSSLPLTLLPNQARIQTMEIALKKLGLIRSAEGEYDETDFVIYGNTLTERQVPYVDEFWEAFLQLEPTDKSVGYLVKKILKLPATPIQCTIIFNDKECFFINLGYSKLLSIESPFFANFFNNKSMLLDCDKKTFLMLLHACISNKPLTIAKAQILLPFAIRFELKNLEKRCESANSIECYEPTAEEFKELLARGIKKLTVNRWKYWGFDPTNDSKPQNRLEELSVVLPNEAILHDISLLANLLPNLKCFRMQIMFDTILIKEIAKHFTNLTHLHVNSKKKYLLNIVEDLSELLNLKSLNTLSLERADIFYDDILKLSTHPTLKEIILLKCEIRENADPYQSSSDDDDSVDNQTLLTNLKNEFLKLNPDLIITIKE